MTVSCFFAATQAKYLLKILFCSAIVTQTIAEFLLLNFIVRKDLANGVWK